MRIILPPLDQLLVIVGAAAFVVLSLLLAALAFWSWRRATRQQTEHLLANHAVVLQRIADLETRVDATNVTVSNLGSRMERPQQLTSVGTAPAPGYQIAIRLAKSGASREELVSGCGLSTQEAELVHRLHAPQSGSRAHRSNAA